MYKLFRTLLLLCAFAAVGCSSETTVSLDGESAFATLPLQPEVKQAKLPIKLFQGDPSQTAPPAVRTLKAGQKPPKPLWKETGLWANLTDYQVCEDPRYHWGAAVVHFDPQTLSNLKEERLYFVRTHFIPPGHYSLKEEKETTANGLRTLYAKGKHARGESQIELKLIEKDDKIFCMRFEAYCDQYPEERAKKILSSLTVEPY